MKAIIPAAGLGTRLYPLTKALPKEMLMLGKKAVIEHVIDFLKNGGVTDIFIVVGMHKNVLINHLGSGKEYGVNIAYLFQEERKGIADAISMVERFVNDETFIVSLGDTYLEPRDLLKDMLYLHKNKKAEFTLAVEKIPDVSTKGIVEIDSQGKIIRLIEKPGKTKVWNNLAITGAYIFESSIFNAIKKTKSGKNNEVQITDSMKILLDDGFKGFAVEQKGNYFDIGTIDDYNRANKYLHNHEQDI